MRNYLMSGKTMSVPKALSVGAAVSILTTMSIAALVSKLIVSETIPWEWIGYGTMFLLYMSSFLGAWSAYRLIRQQKLLISLMSGLIYFGILLSVTALFFGRQYEAVGVSGLVVLAGCGSSGLLGFDRKMGGNGRINKKAYC